MSIIELRSRGGINRATQALNDGDYNGVVSMRFSLHDPYFSGTPLDEFEQDLFETMQAAGRLQHLQILDIGSVNGTSDSAAFCILPVAALAGAIEHAKNLLMLGIYQVCLTGRQEDFLRFAQALEKHGSLRYFTLQCGCRKLGDWRDDLTTPNPLDLVYKSLATIQTLVSISHCAGIFVGALKDSTLVELCRLPRLKTLFIMSCKLSDENITTLATQLKVKTPKTITSLKLCCEGLASRGCKALTELISAENSKLADIGVTINSFEKGEDPTKLISDLTAAVGKSSCNILRFHVVEKPHSTALVESTKMMLRNNYLLEIVVLKRVENGICLDLEDDEIGFLLKTNKLGRGRLFMNQGDATKDVTWMDLFEATEGKLDNIFYLVRSHPNEFAQMGLANEAEKMIPTTRSLKAMFRQNRKETEKSMHSNREETEKSIRCMLRQNEVDMEQRFKAILQEKEKSIQCMRRKNKVDMEQRWKAILQQKLEESEKSMKGMIRENRVEAKLRCQEILRQNKEQMEMLRQIVRENRARGEREIRSEELFRQNRKQMDMIREDRGKTKLPWQDMLHENKEQNKEQMETLQHMIRGETEVRREDMIHQTKEQMNTLQRTIREEMLLQNKEQMETLQHMIRSETERERVEILRQDKKRDVAVYDPLRQDNTEKSTSYLATVLLAAFLAWVL